MLVAPNCAISASWQYHPANLTLLVDTKDVSSCDPEYVVEDYTYCANGTYGEPWHTNGTALSEHSFECRNNPDICHKPALYMETKHRLILWSIIYWFTYFMCWYCAHSHCSRLGFPLVQSYATAGDFRRLERIRTSLKENILFYLVAGFPRLTEGVFVAILIIVIVIIRGITLADLPAFLAISSNMWGLLVLIILLGSKHTHLQATALSKSHASSGVRRTRKLP